MHHEYRRILAGHFINIETHEIYSDVKAPRSAVHDDMGLLSFDAARQRIVLRRFHTEGFAVQYVAELTADNKRIVFLSEATENLPTGSQIRETYASLAADELEHTVELADPGKEFRVSSRAHLKKVR